MYQPESGLDCLICAECSLTHTHHNLLVRVQASEDLRACGTRETCPTPEYSIQVSGGMRLEPFVDELSKSGSSQGQNLDFDCLVCAELTRERLQASEDLRLRVWDARDMSKPAQVARPPKMVK